MIPKNYTTGEYAVGTSCFSLIDKNRKDGLGAGGARRIAVRMYYPVSRESIKGAKKAPVLSERKAKEIGKAMYIRKFPAEYLNAEQYELPMMNDRRFPLIMFSHGYGSYAEANTFLCCDLASHGYIIASIGHANEALENDYDDGEYDVMDKKTSKRMYDKNIISTLLENSRMLKAKMTAKEGVEALDNFQNNYFSYIKGRVIEWVNDTEFAAKAVKERFADHIDLSHGIGVSGHSLGGCTAYYLCRYSSEFTCGINIDGALFGEYDNTPMTRPFCQISCAKNINFETRPFFNTKADTYQVIFEDMEHIGFADVKFFYPFRSVVGKLDDEVLHGNLAYSHYAFFDKYLKGKDGDFVRKGHKKVHYIKIR